MNGLIEDCCYEVVTVGFCKSGEAMTASKYPSYCRFVSHIIFLLEFVQHGYLGVSLGILVSHFSVHSSMCMVKRPMKVHYNFLLVYYFSGTC